MTPYEYCQQKLTQSKTSFYYSFFFLEPLKRKAMTILYAFCREVDDIVDGSDDISTGEQQLTWWEEEIDRIFQQDPQHPIGKAFQEILPYFSLNPTWLKDILKGMKMDLTQIEYQNFSDLQLYCYRVASTVGLLSTEIFGYQDVRSLEYAQLLGTALQLVNIIRDISEDADRGRLYIPLEELNQFSVAKEDIFKKRSSDNLKSLMTFQANRAKAYYQSAQAVLPEIDRHAQQSSLMMAAIYFRLLEQMEERGFPVFKQRMQLTFWQKLLIVSRTLIQEKIRKR